MNAINVRRTALRLLLACATLALPWGAPRVQAAAGSGTSLADLQKDAQSILRGTIRTIEPSPASEAPSARLGVEISDVIKGRAPQSLFYVEYRVTSRRAGLFEPRPGDEILLLDSNGPVDRDPLRFAPRVDEILFQRAGEAVFLPPPLKSARELSSVRTLDEVVDLIGYEPQPVFRKAAR